MADDIVVSDDMIAKVLTNIIDIGKQTLWDEKQHKPHVMKEVRELPMPVLYQLYHRVGRLYK